MNQPTENSTEAMTQDYCKVPESIMKASRDELDNVKLKIEGKLPEDLEGHVFIVAPVGSVNSGGLPDPDGDSVLSGDGMIYRLDFDSQGEVGLKTRIIKPPCYYADEATRPGTKYDKYRFRNYGILRFSVYLGSRNELNTAFLPMKFGDEENPRLLVTYDAGRPYEIDTKTLEVVTPVGANKEWRSESSLKFPFSPVFSTAHPAFDGRKKEMFTVNYGRSIGSFLETLPFIYEIEELPSEVDELLFQLAKVIESLNFVKDLLRTFAKVSQDIFEFYLREIERITNIEIKDFVYLIRWDGAGNLERWKLVLPDGSPVRISQTIHQIGVTEDYVVLMDTSFTTGLAQIINNPFPKSDGLERLLRNLLSRPPLPDSTIYIVRRADLKAGQQPACSQYEEKVVVQKVVIPLEAAHFLVNYENPGGQITLHVAHICAWDISDWLRKYDLSAYQSNNPVKAILNGMQQDEIDISRMGRYVIDGESGEILNSHTLYDSECTWTVALYAYRDFLSSGMPPGKLENIYWVSLGLWKDLMTEFSLDLYEDYKYRAVPVEEMLRLAEKGKPSALFRLDTAKDALEIADRYQFPCGYIASSPQFVPRRNSDEESSTDGYIVCTVFTPDGNEIWIFDAQKLGHKPLCKLSDPSLNFGLTIHTAWLPKIAGHTAEYDIPVRQDYNDLVKQRSPEIQELFETQVYPHFE